MSATNIFFVLMPGSKLVMAIKLRMTSPAKTSKRTESRHLADDQTGSTFAAAAAKNLH